MTTGDVLIFAPRFREEKEKITARARDQLGDSTYRAAVAEGRALSVDDVVDLAREGLKPIMGSDPEYPTATVGAWPRALLSDREQAVLRLVAEGLLNKQIATSLGMGERTVKARLTSAMNKLGVDNRTHAAVVAVQRGLL